MNNNNIDDYYGYPFDFPRGYRPSDTADKDLYYFCQKTFDKYISVIENCMFHVKGSLDGKPLILEKWQKDMIAALFCLKYKSDDRRRYREGFIYVPRKNGKSLWCSAVVLAYFICDPEKGKEVVSVAADSEQASIIYEPLLHALKEKSSPIVGKGNINPDKRFRVYMNPKMIISENKKNKYKVLTSDGDKNHGLNVSLAIMDELHAWKQERGDKIYEAVKTSMNVRKSPLIINITTADHMRDSLCNKKFEKAKKVCSGELDDPAFFPVLYYLDSTADWKDQSNWYKCNPQLNKSIFLHNYEAEFKDALEDPTQTNSFKRLYLNIQTQSETKFLDYNKWISCEEQIDLTDQLCYGGLDLAYKSDLCAFVLVFPYGDKYHVITRLWIPEKHPKIKFYHDRGWIESGDVKTTPGNGIDFKTVREDIAELCSHYKPFEIGYDPRFATELCQHLYNEDGLPMVEVSQSARYLSEPLKDIAVSISNDKFRHDGNKCASWQIGNATAKEMDGGLIKLVKPQGNDATLLKVDFVAALSIAHNRLLFNDDGNFNDSLRKKIKSGVNLL